jgi:hypothetical protein
MDVHALGWTMIPQTRTGRRLPARIDGETLKWGQWIEKAPTAKEVRHWGEQARMENGAVILGKPSGLVWCVDVDILDLEFSYDVQEIAFNIFGETRFRRQGMAPKMALFYRAADESQLPPNRSWKFLDEDGSVSEHGLEILSQGKAITVVGYHHKTSRYFKWGGRSPLTHRPEDVPVATLAQLEEFIEKVQDLRAFYRAAQGSRNSDLSWESVSTDGVTIPKLKLGQSPALWVEKDDLVFDGRENYLWDLTRRMVQQNSRLALTDKGVAQLLTAIAVEFRRNEHHARAWLEADLRDDVSDKVFRAVAALKAGRVKTIEAKVQKTEGAEPAKVVFHDAKYSNTPLLKDTPFPWIGTRRTQLLGAWSNPDPEKAKDRQLDPDRKAVGAAAQADVTNAINAFIDDVVARNASIHLVPAPTGIGKSTNTVALVSERIAEIRSMIEGRLADTGEEIGPTLFLVPSYKNVNELRAKATAIGLDGNLSDDALVLQASERGLMMEGKAKNYVSELRAAAKNSGLNSMTYMGKGRAGCKMEGHMKALQGANIPSSHLCSKKVKVRDSQGRKTDEEETIYCKFYVGCPAIEQREKAAKADLVFLVRNFATLAIPDVLKNPAGVIFDERCWDLFIATKQFPLTTFSKPRREPRLSKKERESGLTTIELLQDRDRACDVAARHLMGGGKLDLARVFSMIKDGKRIVASARRVCGNAMTSQADLEPNMDLKDLEDMCARPAGVHVGEEYRFWKIIEDGILERTEDRLAGRKSPPETRIQLLDPQSLAPDVRISWKLEGNWTGVPLLLLDASADEELIRRSLGGKRETKVHSVDANLNMHICAAVDRRLAISNFFVKEDAAAVEKARAANLLHEVRQIIAATSVWHANGRCFFSIPKKVRRAVLHNWTPPRNADFGHHGAVAGLDFAKNHVAVEYFSRIELPTREIDGIVAALSHGDAKPEPLIDQFGTGLTEDEKTVYPHKSKRLIRRRDGADFIIDAHEHKGELARRVQKQYREEEGRQIVGRGRPVYNERTLKVYAVCESIPENWICDEIVSFEDLARRNGAKLWDAIRLSGGFAEPHILAHVAGHLGDAEFWQTEIEACLVGCPEILANFHEYTIVRDTGEEHRVFVAGHLKAWSNDLIFLLHQINWRGGLKRVRVCQCVVDPADVAPRDELQLYIDAMYPATREREALNALRDKLQTRGMWCPAGGLKAGIITINGSAPTSYRAGDGDFASTDLPMGAWLALETLQDHWVKTGETAEEKAAREAKDGGPQAAAA